ncbi:cyclohexadienyl dehydratase [Allostella sp. ATCC 35155]|nr:cyclohexadienyl dehydratase [Stella sp. ATCC 35155]
MPFQLSTGLRVVPAVIALSLLSAIAQAGASSRLDLVREHGVLRPCIWPDYYAVTYRDPRSGRLEGLDIDLARALAQDLGVQVEFVETSFANFMDDLEQGRCDVAMFGVGITPARRERVDFTRPYLVSGIYGVAPKASRRIRAWGDVDRPGVVVAVQAGTFMEPFMRDYLSHARLMVVRAPQSREIEVQSGRADLFVTDYPYSRRMLDQHDWARLIAPEKPIGRTGYAYAVAKGQPEWLARLDAFVASIRADGRLEAAARRHALSPIVAR